MKFYIVVIGIVLLIELGSAAMSDEQKMKAEGILKECVQQVGIAPETMDRIRAGDWTDHSVEAKVNLLIICRSDAIRKDTRKQRYLN